MNTEILFKLLIIVTISCVQCDSNNCTEVKCPVTAKHYKELGCVPVIESGDCCAKRFDCSVVESYNKTKCYFRGKEYSIGEAVDTSETIQICETDCYCALSSNDRYAEFNCADIECPEFFDMEYHKCAKIRHKNMCCASNFICDPAEVDKLPVCVVDGVQYKLGDKIYPNSVNCYQCMCTENFDNSTLIGNPNCNEIDCGTTLVYLRELYSGCVPVYLENTECCPIEWRCPKSTDVVISNDIDTANQEESYPNMTCTFGEHRLKIGEAVKTSNKCLSCICTTPPLLHCLTSLNC